MDPREEPNPGWIARLQAGDEAAFEALVRRYERPLYGYLLQRLRDRAAAEDVFSEVFVRVLKHLPRWKPTGRFSAWLFTIAHRLAADYAEREARRRGAPLDDLAPGRTPASPEPGPEREAASGEARRRIEEELAALPGEQREVFLLREVAGLSFAEIADALDCPLNTALGRMRLAVLKLRKGLEAYDA